MRQLATLKDAPTAHRFVDHLLTQDVKAQVMPEGDGFEIWVHDENQLPRASQELKAFTLNPECDRYHSASVKAASLRRAQHQAEKKARRNYINLKEAWGIGHAGVKPVTGVFIALSCIVALWTNLGRGNPWAINQLTIASYQITGTMIQWAGLQDIASGQWWRLVTPIFLHFGLMHLLFNMYWLYAFGGLIEHKRRGAFLLWIILLCAIPSNLGQYWLGGPSFGGMSGVVYGLFGYIWLKGRYDPTAGMAVPQSTVYILLGWFVLGFTGILPVANGAHGFGLLMGCLAGGWRYALRRIAKKLL